MEQQGLLNPEAPASDILSSLCGANIIGVNREPIRLPNEPIDEATLRYHKARIFDNNSYYYVKVGTTTLPDTLKNNLILNKTWNMFYNAILLDSELSNQANYFLDNLEIRNYILKKRMIHEYQKGKLKELLFQKHPPRITEWF